MSNLVTGGHLKPKVHFCEPRAELTPGTRRTCLWNTFSSSSLIAVLVLRWNPNTLGGGVGPSRPCVGGAPPPPALWSPVPQAHPGTLCSARAHPSAPNAFPCGVSYSTPALKWISLEKISLTSHSKPFVLLIPPFNLPWMARISPAVTYLWCDYFSSY